jgi:hypothetical protein
LVLIDFVVLDMQEDTKTPLILGRPFLRTINTHIDIGAGEIKFHINGKEERFVFKPSQNNAPIWSGVRSKYQGLHLRDRRI